MSAEIAEQGNTWARAAESSEIERVARFVERAAPALVVFSARGTSDHAAIYGQYLMQATLGLPAYLATPSLASVFEASPFAPGTLLIAVSQSGSSPDILATVKAARAAGTPTLAITNSASSALAVLADEHLDIGAGPELSVAATKSYTAELAAIYSLVERLRSSTTSHAARSLTQLAVTFERDLSALYERGETVGASMREADRALVIGRGYSLATAKEAALKLMETSALAASGWSAADAKHGPIGQVLEGTPVVLLTASPSGKESVLQLLGGLDSRGAQVHVLEGLDWGSITSQLIPLLEIVPLQVAALALSRARGLDADQPSGLSKVTLTR
jgi:glucosamine--fructose-6-phosphate aminotransferase (isomerizing)